MLPALAFDVSVVLQNKGNKREAIPRALQLALCLCGEQFAVAVVSSRVASTAVDCTSSTSSTLVSQRGALALQPGSGKWSGASSSSTTLDSCPATVTVTVALAFKSVSAQRFERNRSHFLLSSHVIFTYQNCSFGSSTCLPLTLSQVRNESENEASSFLCSDGPQLVVVL
eukprot:scpid17420/ scgid28425/ 